MNDEIKETLEYKIDFLTKSLNIGIPTKNRRYFNDIKDYITNLKQENERLKENNQNMQEEMCRCWQRIDQLTNDWNELEEWVKQRIDKIKYNSYDDILDKMKEIKENNE